MKDSIFLPGILTKQYKASHCLRRMKPPKIRIM